MSDHDRGAYTPQPDAPLQFDARGPRGRRPLPMTLIGSGGVLVVLLGALALHYQHGVRGAGDPARPVGEPIVAIKTVAPAGAAPRSTGVGADVYGAKTAEVAKIPTFAPAPEAPQPRPAPHLTVQIEGAAPKGTPTTRVATTASPAVPTTVATASTKAAPANATTVVAKIAQTPVAKPIAPAKTVALVKATPQPTKTSPVAPVAKTTAGAATTVASGSAVVQIGAFSSTALADKGWGDVSSTMSGEMAGKSKRVEALEKGGSTLYRTSVTGFSSRAAATAFCDGLKAKGKICFVKS